MLLEAGGGPQGPASAAALGGLRLRGRGRGASCPVSMVSMVSFLAALGTSDALLLRRRAQAGHGAPHHA